MTLNILLDMNLSPCWVARLETYGWNVVHWSSVGDPTARDTEIMVRARTNQHVVFTHDLDLRTMLALTHKAGPSVLQVRAENILPEQVEDLVADDRSHRDRRVAAHRAVGLHQRLMHPDQEERRQLQVRRLPGRDRAMLHEQEIGEGRAVLNQGRARRRLYIIQFQRLGARLQHAVQLLGADRVEVETADQSLGESGDSNGNGDLLTSGTALQGKSRRRNSAHKAPS